MQLQSGGAGRDPGSISRSMELCQYHLEDLYLVMLGLLHDAPRSPVIEISVAARLHSQENLSCTYPVLSHLSQPLHKAHMVRTLPVLS